MKRYILSACMAMSLFGQVPAFADPLKVGFSLDTKESSLETAWETFLKSEGEAQGKAAGYEFEWTINVANADPSRQAANIDDLITAGVDIIIARAFDSGAIGTPIKAAEDAGIRSSPSTAARPAASRPPMSVATATTRLTAPAWLLPTSSKRPASRANASNSRVC